MNASAHSQATLCEELGQASALLSIRLPCRQCGLYIGSRRPVSSRRPLLWQPPAASASPASVVETDEMLSQLRQAIAMRSVPAGLVRKLKVAQLKGALEEEGLSTRGVKADLINRLESAWQAKQQGAASCTV